MSLLGPNPLRRYVKDAYIFGKSYEIRLRILDLAVLMQPEAFTTEDDSAIRGISVDR